GGVGVEGAQDGVEGGSEYGCGPGVERIDAGNGVRVRVLLIVGDVQAHVEVDRCPAVEQVRVEILLGGVQVIPIAFRRRARGGIAEIKASRGVLRGCPVVGGQGLATTTTRANKGDGGA